jgi:putative nucleotidyltransferase with HDIG domain
MLKERCDAYELLKSLGASERLMQHAQVVAEAADRLMQELKGLGVSFDAHVVELGAVLHDAGKTRNAEELSASGSMHQQAGQALLLAHGVQPEVARCCASHGHGAWNLPDVSFEELVVALADKLWKGRREAGLELMVVDEVAARLGASRWDVFERLDTAFELIAADGPERLLQSRPGVTS